MKKNIKIFFIFILIVFIILFCGSALNDSKLIKIGVYQNEPKIFVDAKGNVNGIWINIIKEIAKEENWKIQFIIADWQTCLENLLNGKIDIMPDVAFSDERAAIFDFNKIPILISYSKIYCNKSIRIKKISDLNNKKIAVLNQSIQEKNLFLLKQNLFFNFEIIKVNSLKDGFTITKQGETDCVITNSFFGDYFHKEYDLKETEIELFPVELFFVTKKGENLDLIFAIDEIISNWKLDKNSIYYKILRKWKASPKTRVNNLFTYSILFAALLIIYLAIYILLIRAKLNKTYETLSVSEKYFKEYSDLSPIGIFKTDINGKIIFMNKFWSEITGFDINESLGHGFLEKLNINEKNEIKDLWVKSLSEQKEFEKIFSILDINGVNHWLKIKVKPLFDEKRVLDGFIGVFDDITEEKVLNIRLSKTLEELNFLYELTSAMNKSIIIPDLSYVILNKIIEFFRIDAAILFLVKNDSIVSYDIQPEKIRNTWVTKEVHKFGECFCGKSLQDGKVFYVKNLCEIEDLQRDECVKAGFKSIAVVPLKYLDNILGLILLASFSEYDFSCHNQILESISNQIAIAFNSFLLHSEIITYSKELEKKVYERTKELQDALEKAQFADRMKSAFLATMSHELRTPLNSIIGFTGVLLQELPGKLNDEQKKQLSMVKSSSQHLLDLINDVLDLSKIEAGELKLSYEKFELIPFIEEISNIILPMTQKKALEYEVKISSNIGAINCDKRRLKQIIINFLSNAIKFTNQGKISLIVEKEDNIIKFSIIDTGIGIKEEDKKFLFKPFSQINQGLNRNYEGTGLGLSICKNLIKMLGGEVEVESEYGKGSKFIFTIPNDIGNI